MDTAAGSVSFQMAFILRPLWQPRPSGSNPYTRDDPVVNEACVFASDCHDSMLLISWWGQSKTARSTVFALPAEVVALLDQAQSRLGTAASFVI